MTFKKVGCFHDNFSLRAKRIVGKQSQLLEEITNPNIDTVHQKYKLLSLFK